MPTLECVGIASLIEGDEIKRHKNGCFYVIPSSMAARAVEKEGGVPFKFYHQEDLEIGTVNSFELENIPFDDEIKPALIANFTIDEEPFIEAIQDSVVMRNMLMNCEYTSSDGFIPNAKDVATDDTRDMTAYSTIISRFPGLSLGHSDNQTYDIYEMSLCLAGQREGTAITKCKYEKNAKGVKRREKPYYDRVLAGCHSMGNRILYESAEKCFRKLNIPITNLVYSHTVSEPTKMTKQNMQEAPQINAPSTTLVQSLVHQEVQRALEKEKLQQHQQLPPSNMYMTQPMYGQQQQSHIMPPMDMYHNMNMLMQDYKMRNEHNQRSRDHDTDSEPPTKLAKQVEDIYTVLTTLKQHQQQPQVQQQQQPQYAQPPLQLPSIYQPAQMQQQPLPYQASTQVPTLQSVQVPVQMQQHMLQQQPFMQPQIPTQIPQLQTSHVPVHIQPQQFPQVQIHSPPTQAQPFQAPAPQIQPQTLTPAPQVSHTQAAAQTPPAEHAPPKETSADVNHYSLRLRSKNNPKNKKEVLKEMFNDPNYLMGGPPTE